MLLQYTINVNLPVDSDYHCISVTYLINIVAIPKKKEISFRNDEQEARIRFYSLFIYEMREFFVL